MSWYSDYRNEWKEIIETVARECGRAELMVEKDTIQSIKKSDASQTDAIKEGSLVTFGAYEQNGDTSNGKEVIQWICLKDKKTEKHCC